MSADQNQQFDIRRMTEPDLDAVVHLDKISFSAPWPPDSFAYELRANPNAHCWVAVDRKETVVGFLVLWLVADEAHIATLAVHPEHRREGIGQQLVITCLSESIHKGAGKAYLEVRAGNHAALKMYQKFGFLEVGRRPRYYQDNLEDAVLMTRKPLDGDYYTWLQAGAWEKWTAE